MELLHPSSDLWLYWLKPVIVSKIESVTLGLKYWHHLWENLWTLFGKKIKKTLALIWESFLGTTWRKLRSWNQEVPLKDPWRYIGVDQWKFVGSSWTNVELCLKHIFLKTCWNNVGDQAEALWRFVKGTCRRPSVQTYWRPIWSNIVEALMEYI